LLAEVDSFTNNKCKSCKYLPRLQNICRSTGLVCNFDMMMKAMMKEKMKC